MTTAIDLPRLTRGQAGALRLTPSDPTQTAPFVVALRVTRSKSHSQETASSPHRPGRTRATAADNESLKDSIVR